MLIVTTWGGGCQCCRRLTGGGQAYLRTSGNTEDSPPQQKILWLEIVTVSRLRYPALDQHTCTTTQCTCSWYSSLTVSPRECLVTLLQSCSDCLLFIHWRVRDPPPSVAWDGWNPTSHRWDRQQFISYMYSQPRGGGHYTSCSAAQGLPSGRHWTSRVCGRQTW